MLADTNTGLLPISSPYSFLHFTSGCFQTSLCRTLDSVHVTLWCCCLSWHAVRGYKVGPSFSLVTDHEATAWWLPRSISMLYIRNSSFIPTQKTSITNNYVRLFQWKEIQCLFYWWKKTGIITRNGSEKFVAHWSSLSSKSYLCGSQWSGQNHDFQIQSKSCGTLLAEERPHPQERLNNLCDWRYIGERKSFCEWKVQCLSDGHDRAMFDWHRQIYLRKTLGQTGGAKDRANHCSRKC